MFEIINRLVFLLVIFVMWVLSLMVVEFLWNILFFIVYVWMVVSIDGVGIVKILFVV